MAKSAKRKSASYDLNPSVHRAIVREVTNLVRPIMDEHFKLKYFEQEWLSKLNDPESDVTANERRERAIEKWLTTEERNYRTNQRLFLETTSFKGVCSDAILGKARSFILDVLGESVPDEVWSKGRFSNGASTSKTRLQGRGAQKFRDKADITPSAEAFLYYYNEGLPIELGCTRFRSVPGNILFTVPKNASIDRVACKEPDINMYLQLAVGGHIRERLMHSGINLNKQEINSELARQGSVTGELATVDLSSASDSITTTLVNKLLPPEWFVLMDRIRSRETLIDGVVHENNMFSSMGNGFTFELESLIFWALTRSVCYYGGFRGTISVYGDDIIVPSAATGLLKDVFGFCGLLFNSKKSFSSGPFRESCGGHWYNGVDVKPFYIKQPINHVSRLIHFLNRLRAWCAVDGICDPRFYPLWKKWAKLVPSNLKGGRDCERIDALVSFCSPRHVLVQVSRDITKKDTGAYLTWHNLKTVNSHATPEVVEVLPLQKFVVRRRKRQPDGDAESGWDVSTVPAFPQEVGKTDTLDA